MEGIHVLRRRIVSGDNAMVKVPHAAHAVVVSQLRLQVSEKQPRAYVLKWEQLEVWPFGRRTDVFREVL